MDPASVDSEKATPAPEDYDANGVDRTLVRWALSLTPAERLASLERMLRDITALRALNERPGSR